MARDILFAAFIGGGSLMSAWILAFTIPNLFRRLLGEGALGTALVPLLSRSLEEKAGRHKASREFMLLVYDDNKGRPVITGNDFLYSLAGAVLLELYLKNKISIRDKLVYVESYKTSGDVTLDQVMEQIRKSPKNKKIKYWVQKFGFRGNKLKSSILDQMVNSRIYRKKENKVMGLFTCRKYYNSNPGYKKELQQKIRKIVLEESGITEELFILVSLVGTSGLVRKLFTNSTERKFAKRKIKEMIKDNDFGKAISDTIASANAAIVAAVSAGAVVATGSS
jgi:hypothetical protein